MSNLKAYIVTETCENTCGVFFAKHAIEARKAGASKFNEGELGGMKCERAPGFDKFAPGPVPKLELVDIGWWFECHGCLVRIDSDCRSDEDDEGPTRKLKPIEVGNAIYCSAECREQFLTEKALLKKLQAEAIADLRAKLIAKVPGVEISGDDPHDRDHAYVTQQRDGTYATQQCVVHFRFPGCKIAPASFRFDKVGEEPRALVCAGDLEAWNGWRAETTGVAA